MPAPQLATVLGAARRLLRGAEPVPPRAVSPVPADPGERALAAGVPARLVPELGSTLDALSGPLRRQVLEPFSGEEVRWGEAPARQVDGTTCGSAVLVCLAASGDPSLALWLATGRSVGEHVPPELRLARHAFPGAPVATGAARFALVQRALRRLTNRSWPRALGTPPWGAALAARHGRTRFEARLLDDADPSASSLVDQAALALAAGVPVPLYVGGDLSGGIAAAVPRHVVLLVGREAGTFRVYEPGSARVLPVHREVLCGGGPGRPVAALGGWWRVSWILLPRQ